MAYTNQAMVMTQQPGVQTQGGQWMNAPPASLGCPPGLEYLAMIDQVLVKQKKEMLEILTGCETNNHYIIKNTMGQQVYKVDEETGTCMRICCGPSRGFVLHVTDNSNQEVMRIIREFHCCTGCCWCAGKDASCAFEVRVEAPVGNVIGYTRQMQSCWKIVLDVMNEQRETVFRVRGPCCPCGCHDVEFPLLSKDETREVGRITKQWAGCCAETFTDADNFSISWPVDLDIKMKATLLGTLFLVDFMAFESQQDNNHNN